MAELKTSSFENTNLVEDPMIDRIVHENMGEEEPELQPELAPEPLFPDLNMDMDEILGQGMTHRQVGDPINEQGTLGSGDFDLLFPPDWFVGNDVNVEQASTGGNSHSQVEDPMVERVVQEEILRLEEPEPLPIHPEVAPLSQRASQKPRSPTGNRETKKMGICEHLYQQVNNFWPQGAQ